MTKQTVRFIVTGEGAQEPTKAHADDAAFDLYACLPDWYDEEEQAHIRGGCFLEAGDIARVNTGIAVQIPEGHAGLVLPRSGLAVKHGITIINAPGLIDPGYSGNVQVALWNTSKLDYTVQNGDRIAQLLIVQTAPVELRRSAWLSHSERADGGFGSSGR